MRRLAPLLLLALALSGCTDVGRFFDGVQGKPGFAEATKLDERVDFAVTDLPPQQHRFEFTLDAGTRSVAVSVGVRFTDAGAPLALPQQGQVTVNITSPNGVEGAATLTATNSTEVLRDNPAPGAWAVQVGTLGDGTVRVLAVASVPAKP
ncbi:MAG: hypothetical protein LC624_03100 [Halobacteriales archaeon]|nr:hypothetical protein [Halobacteriales archaeon]